MVEVNTFGLEATQATENTEEPVFSPNNLRVNKRHTRILGTLNKRANQEFINTMVKYGMDGIRIFRDYGSEVCTNLI